MEDLVSHSSICVYFQEPILRMEMVGANSAPVFSLVDIRNPGGYWSIFTTREQEVAESSTMSLVGMKSASRMRSQATEMSLVLFVALIFLIFALFASTFDFTSRARMADNIAWIRLEIGLAMVLILFMFSGGHTFNCGVYMKSIGFNLIFVVQNMIGDKQ